MKKDFEKEYAIALFDISLEEDLVDTIKDELKIVSSLFLENKDFIKVLTHPQLSKENKKEIIYNVFKEIDQLLINFLYVLIENDRISEVLFINDEFIKLYNEYKEVIYVDAYSTILLSNDQIENLKFKLTIKYRHKVVINNLIDNTLVGGLLIKINNELLDFSIKNQFINLKTHILKQS